MLFEDHAQLNVPSMVVLTLVLNKNLPYFISCTSVHRGWLMLSLSVKDTSSLVYRGKVLMIQVMSTVQYSIPETRYIYAAFVFL